MAIFRMQYPLRTASFSTGVLFAIILFSPWAPAAETTPADSDPSLSSLRQRIDAVMADAKPSTRLKRLSELGPTLSAEDIPAALELAGTLPQFRERGVLTTTALRRWADLDPAGAFAFIARMRQIRDHHPRRDPPGGIRSRQGRGCRHGSSRPCLPGRGHRGDCRDPCKERSSSHPCVATHASTRF